MKAARIYLPCIIALSVTMGSTAWAEKIDMKKGRAMMQMTDALYGDYFKCINVPRYATAPKPIDKIFGIGMSSPLVKALGDDERGIEGRQKPLRDAMRIAYFVLSVVVGIALSTIFIWMGANIAGQRSDHGNFNKALLCAFFDRIIITALAIGAAFIIGSYFSAGDLSGAMGEIVIPAALLVFFFFVSTYIVKLVYNIKWPKAFLIQLCTRVAALLVAVFILGFASALSLTTTV